MPACWIFSDGYTSFGPARPFSGFSASVASNARMLRGAAITSLFRKSKVSPLLSDEEKRIIEQALPMLDHLFNSRYIVEPFHLYDCCLVSNGGTAVILTSAECARSLKQPSVYVLGMGQAARGLAEILRQNDIETVAFTSSQPCGSESYCGMPAVPLNSLADLQFDRLVVGSQFFFEFEKSIQQYDPAGAPIFPAVA